MVDSGGGTGGLKGLSPSNKKKSEGVKVCLAPANICQVLQEVGTSGRILKCVLNIFCIGPIHIQLRTVRKCCFRPSGGFENQKIFLYALRQPMLTLRLDSLPST